ncbi:MAG: hypothetical protein ACLPSW_32635 [Roseiarcus sp.]
MGQPFDGEFSAPQPSFGLHDSAAQVAALLQIGGSNSASESASEVQRDAPSGGRDSALGTLPDGAKKLDSSRNFDTTFPRLT